MMAMILVSSFAECLVGVIILKLVSIIEFADDHKELYLTITGFLIMIYDLGCWTIIWHVTFKYWETARQFSRMVRMF